MKQMLAGVRHEMKCDLTSASAAERPSPIADADGDCLVREAALSAGDDHRRDGG